MSTFDLVVSGRIVGEETVIYGEIGINKGKIIDICEGIGNFVGRERIDAHQSYVFPGAIDVHVHCFSNPEEGFYSTSAAAAAGGVTTFLDMPYDLPNPINHVDQLNKKIEKLEKEAVVDVGLWGTISKRNGTDQIVPMAQAGAMAFKMSTFETDEYRFPKIPDSEIIKSMNILRDVNLVVAFHSENDELILDYIEEYQRKNKVYPRAHAETRPPVTETSSTLKLLEFAYWTKAKLHIVHVSHPRTIELIDYFKSQGTNVTAETCFPYLLLNTNHLDEFGPLAKINPPLRESKDVEQMWQYLEEGKIDFVSSDHAPWKKEQKDKGRENIFLSQSGLPGVELLAPIMYDGTVAAQKMTPIQFAKVMARHPAETFQIKNKGKIKAGYDADFMIIDPHQTVKIDVKRFRSKSKFSPFNGRTLNGKITHTIVRGKVVFDGEEITVDPGYGQFVPGSAIESNVMS